jgi:hypothetical protein
MEQQRNSTPFGLYSKVFDYAIESSDDTGLPRLKTKFVKTEGVVPRECRRFCVVKASDFNKSQQLSTKRLAIGSISTIETTNFNRVQHDLESGSGPDAVSSHDGHRRLIRKLSPSTEKGVISAVSQIKAEITS